MGVAEKIREVNEELRRGSEIKSIASATGNWQVQLSNGGGDKKVVAWGLAGDGSLNPYVVMDGKVVLLLAKDIGSVREAR